MLLILNFLCLIVATVDSSVIYQYGFGPPRKPAMNQKITTVPVKTNIYVQFNVTFTANTFNTPTSEIDNIFQIGEKNYYPSAFINTTQKQMFFRLATDSPKFDYLNVTYADKLRTDYMYSVIIQKAETNWKIIINNNVIYNQKTNAHLIDFSKPLYMSHSLYNPADVRISQFKVITSDKEIYSAQLTNEGYYNQKSVIVFNDKDQSDSDEEEEIEDKENDKQAETEIGHCGFDASFKPQQNVIIDAINIYSYIYLAFNVKFYKNYQNNWSPTDDQNNWSLTELYNSSEEEELLNILHIGDSESNSYPSIYLKDSTNMITFKFGTFGREEYLVEYFIKKGKTYNIEIYRTNKRFQISVNKQVIYDTSSIGYKHMIDRVNQPIYFSNPWNPSANVKISNFTIKSSANNISNGENIKNYPYPYCLRLYDHNGGLINGIYYPNGTYNDHFMFTKEYLPSINHPLLYLFYFDKSWRIYTELYNSSNINDPQVWFLKCDMDTFNMLSCNKRFHYQNPNLRSTKKSKKYSIVHGYCDELSKTPPPTPEPTHKPTPNPTLKPTTTLAPTLRQTVIPQYAKSGVDILTWNICCLVFGVLWFIFICFAWVVVCKTNVFKNREIAPFIYFPGNQKYYQTNLANEEGDMY
eukprot:241285_1